MSGELVSRTFIVIMVFARIVIVGIVFDRIVIVVIFPAESSLLAGLSAISMFRMAGRDPYHPDKEDEEENLFVGKSNDTALEVK